MRLALKPKSTRKSRFSVFVVEQTFPEVAVVRRR
jgi:hypothetical protein